MEIWLLIIVIFFYLSYNFLLFILYKSTFLSSGFCILFSAGSLFVFSSAVLSSGFISLILLPSGFSGFSTLIQLIKTAIEFSDIFILPKKSTLDKNKDFFLSIIIFLANIILIPGNAFNSFSVAVFTSTVETSAFSRG